MSEISILLRSGKKECLSADPKFGDKSSSENMFRFVSSTKPQEIATCMAANKFLQYQESNCYRLLFRKKKDKMAWILGRLEN